MFSDIIILAGGSGQRLWPASTPDCPKQFMYIERNVTFLQASLQRALALKPEGNIVIITRHDIADHVAKNCAELLATLEDHERAEAAEKLIIIAEPLAQNTAPALALGCVWIQSQRRAVRPSVIMMTSDHKIEPVSAFVRDIEKAYAMIDETALVCFGIPPTEPSTEFGYIKAGERCSKTIDGILKVEKFREKPDRETAVSYIKEGNYFWNSGMYGFRCDSFMKELAAYAPNVANCFLPEAMNTSVPVIALNHGVRVLEKWEAMEKAYTEVTPVSVDYAVAENTTSICTLKASFSWDDAGNWDAFARLCEEPRLNVTETESSGSFVYSDIPVTLCGVTDLIVVIKNGQALVMQKGKSHLIKEALRTIKARRDSPAEKTRQSALETAQADSLSGDSAALNKGKKQ